MSGRAEAAFKYTSMPALSVHGSPSWNTYDTYDGKPPASAVLADGPTALRSDFRSGPASLPIKTDFFGDAYDIEESVKAGAGVGVGSNTSSTTTTTTSSSSSSSSSTAKHGRRATLLTGKAATKREKDLSNLHYHTRSSLSLSLSHSLSLFLCPSLTLSLSPSLLLSLSVTLSLSLSLSHSLTVSLSLFFLCPSLSVSLSHSLTLSV